MAAAVMWEALAGSVAVMEAAVSSQQRLALAEVAAAGLAAVERAAGAAMVAAVCRAMAAGSVNVPACRNR